jgi:PTH1 family peptidyl-tRNA hydrolase
MAAPWLVVGLGNPGPRYARNRHNIGFRVVDEIARRHNLPAWKDRLGGQNTTGVLQLGAATVKTHLLKPMEFMNLSGFAVQKSAAFFAVAPAHMAIIHDEIDLDFGVVRVKQGGGHGGHNGLRSIMEQLGNPGFARIRVGVGKPAGGTDVAAWVLSDFPADHQRAVDDLVNASADATLAILASGVTTAMNQFNGKPAISVI